MQNNVLPLVPRGRPAGRRPNADYRGREYLTEPEVEQLIAAARQVGRHRHRDATLILLTYRHGLRVSEAVGLRWEQVLFADGFLHVRRLKNGLDSSHPLTERELRALRKLQRDYQTTPFVFETERKGPMTALAARHVIKRAGREAGLGFSVHPHMLRHGCGFYLAKKGVDTRRIQQYLGHRNIQNTVVYTALAPNSFRDLWEG